MHTVTNNTAIRMFTPSLEGTSSTFKAGDRLLRASTWQSDFSAEWGVQVSVLGLPGLHETHLDKMAKSISYWAADPRGGISGFATLR